MAAKMPEICYSCEVCGKDGMSDEDLRSHMLLAHLEGTTSCPFCDLGDVSPDEMVMHVNSAHLDYLSPQDEMMDSFMVTNGFGDHILTNSLPDESVRQRTINVKSNYNHVPTITVNDEDDANANAMSPSHKRSESAGSSNQGSPSRAQLSLNLNHKEFKNRLINSNLRSPIIEQRIVLCPLCGLREKSPTKLEEHVNRAHFDLTSPSFPAMTPQEEVVILSCPFCLKEFETSPDLELHVNHAHKDILSPAKVSLYVYSYYIVIHVCMFW